MFVITRLLASVIIFLSLISVVSVICLFSEVPHLLSQSEIPFFSFLFSQPRTYQAATYQTASVGGRYHTQISPSKNMQEVVFMP